MAISPVYSAARAGLHPYVHPLHAQRVGGRARVVEVAPPPVETPLFRRGSVAETQGQCGLDVVVRQTAAGSEVGHSERRRGLTAPPPL